MLNILKKIFSIVVTFIVAVVIFGIKEGIQYWGEKKGVEFMEESKILHVLTYAVPGLLCGLLAGLIPFYLLKQRGNDNPKYSLRRWIFIISGIAGLIGGISFSIGAAVILSVYVIRTCQKNSN